MVINMRIIISYLLIFALIIVFALFLDATSGFFVLIIFISAIIISTVLHIYALKKFDCFISVNAELVEKGEEVKLTLLIPKAAFFLPTIFEIKFNFSYHLESEQESYTVTLGRQEKQQVFILKSRFWGESNIAIARVNAADILGIFSAVPRLGSHIGYLKSKTFYEKICRIKIFPSIPDLSGHSEFVRVLEDASAYDDNEQSREVPYAITGFPGYEHRDYVPGDPFKSINWKLSAKRDRLLVRKPEAYAGGDQVLVLDCRSSVHHDNLTARTHEQLAIESLLALARILSKQEIVCRAYIRFNDSWGMTVIEGEDDIEKLRYAFTEYQFTQADTQALYDISGEKASGYVIFTACPDKTLYSQTENLRQKGIIPEIVSPVEGYANNWNIHESDGEIIINRG